MLEDMFDACMQQLSKKKFPPDLVVYILRLVYPNAFVECEVKSFPDVRFTIAFTKEICFDAFEHVVYLSQNCLMSAPWDCTSYRLLAGHSTGSRPVRKTRNQSIWNPLPAQAPNSGYKNGTGSVVRFNLPVSLAFCQSDIYICDRNNHSIRKYDITSGEVDDFANGVTQTLLMEFNGRDLSMFFFPNSIMSIKDEAGKDVLVISDTGNNRIVKMIPGNYNHTYSDFKIYKRLIFKLYVMVQSCEHGCACIYRPDAPLFQNEHMQATETCLFDKHRDCPLCDEKRVHSIMSGDARKVVIPGIQILSTEEIYRIHQSLPRPAQAVLADPSNVVTILQEAENETWQQGPEREFEMTRILQTYMGGGLCIVPRTLFQRELSISERMSVSESMSLQRKEIECWYYKIANNVNKVHYLSRLSKMQSIVNNYEKEIFLALQENAGPEMRAVKKAEFSEPGIAETLKEHVLSFMTSLSGILQAGFFHRDLHDENMTFDERKLLNVGDACAFRIIDWGMSIKVTSNSNVIRTPTNIDLYYNSRTAGLSGFTQVPLEWYLYEQLLDHHFKFDFFEEDTFENVDDVDVFFSRVKNSPRVQLLNTKERFREWTSGGDTSALSHEMLNGVWMAARNKFYYTLRRPNAVSYWYRIRHNCRGIENEDTDGIPPQQVAAFIQHMSNGSRGVLQRLDTFGASKNILELLYRITPVHMLSSGPIHDCAQVLRCLVLEPNNSMQMLNLIARHHSAGFFGFWTYFTRIFGEDATERNERLFQNLQELLFTAEIRNSMQWLTPTSGVQNQESLSNVFTQHINLAGSFKQDRSQLKRAIDLDSASSPPRLRKNGAR